MIRPADIDQFTARFVEYLKPSRVRIPRRVKRSLLRYRTEFFKDARAELSPCAKHWLGFKGERWEAMKRLLDKQPLPKRRFSPSGKG